MAKANHYAYQILMDKDMLRNYFNLHKAYSSSTSVKLEDSVQEAYLRNSHRFDFVIQAENDKFWFDKRKYEQHEIEVKNSQKRVFKIFGGLASGLLVIYGCLALFILSFFLIFIGVIIFGALGFLAI